jgi:CubicO group peptidase (beta-lactamase class C family)
MFSLASISKPITATGLMRLVEQGKVSLDRPINEYLGIGHLSGLAGDAARATVRQVMSHTAGLPLHYQFYYETEGYAEPSMDETITRYAILVNPPGEVYQYSNLGYGILDHVIARVSGQTYGDYMMEQVFKPLGLSRTSVHLPSSLAHFATKRYDAKAQAIPFYDFDHDGGSAVWSSAHDLVRFGMFHLKNHLPDQERILADSTIDRMQRILTPGDTTRGYGLGWGIERDMGYRQVSHTGGMPGVATLLSLYPEENLAVVVLTNRSSPGAFTIGQDLIAAVLPPFADSLRARRARRDSSPQPPPFTPPPELAGEWEGTIRTWDTTIAFTLVFQPDGDVHARVGDQLRTLVTNPRWRDSSFTGRFLATLPTEDARRHVHTVLLNLRLKRGRLFGQATAQTTADPVHFALTSYAELTRKQ